MVVENFRNTFCGIGCLATRLRRVNKLRVKFLMLQLQVLGNLGFHT
jgi:hypothetical protein